MCRVVQGGPGRQRQPLRDFILRPLDITLMTGGWGGERRSRAGLMAAVS